jgi:hypothetical protein
MIAVAAAGIGFYRVSELSRHHLPGLFDLEHLNVDSALNRYSDYDLSFRIARNILQTEISFFPTTRAGRAESSAPELDSFYSFLQENTNIPESVKVSPKEVNIAGRLTRTGGNRPNIFIIVVDSLRQDYVSPYNDRVTFTPSIESFASDSAVFKKAFTSYAGTVLAEPSIWVGAMQLHKQYIEPFYPLNALQKLVEMEGYQCFVTIDPVLEKTMKRSAAIEELDKGLDWVDYDLCRTVEELQSKLDERQDLSRPVFVYTQAQNLHIVMRNHRMRTNPPTESFPGFDAFYASQVKRVDECFGRFIQQLKDRGLYDNSIIILTADHGDNLGEGGRWGHGYYLYPELIRIPIIMRIPASLKKEMVWSKEQTALLTDITPSLYYLLGHRPVERNPVFGRPLFTKTEKEQSEYMRPSYLLGSSYGAIYGTISNDGRWLFFSDSTIQEDFYYDLEVDPTATRNLLTPTIRQEQRRIIRDYILAISRFYNFGVVSDEPMP